MDARQKEASVKRFPVPHEEWAARRPKATSESIAKALEILDRPTPHPAEESDKLPRGYVSVRRKYAGKQRP